MKATLSPHYQHPLFWVLHQILGHTRAEISELTGLSYYTIKRLEQGQAVQPPSINRLRVGVDRAVQAAVENTADLHPSEFYEQQEFRDHVRAIIKLARQSVDHLPLTQVPPDDVFLQEIYNQCPDFASIIIDNMKAKYNTTAGYIRSLVRRKQRVERLRDPNGFEVWRYKGKHPNKPLDPQHTPPAHNDPEVEAALVALAEEERAALAAVDPSTPTDPVLVDDLVDDETEPS